MNKYSEMPDSEFLKLLESKLEETNWTVGEIVELERRGLELVSSNSNLSKALLMKRSEFTSSIRKALEPYSRNIETFTNEFNKLKNLQLGKFLALNPRIENLPILSPETAQNLVLKEIAGFQELSLKELQVIRQQNVRDWFQWLILISSVVAALGVVSPLFFS